MCHLCSQELYPGALSALGICRDCQKKHALLAATFGHEVTRTFWAGRKVSAPDTEQPIGVFEAYICRRCGYTELYSRDAASIPIGDEYGTELFEISSGTPYR